MIEADRNTLTGAFDAPGNLICGTSPRTLGGTPTGIGKIEQINSPQQNLPYRAVRL